MDLQQIVILVLGILYFLFKNSGSKKQPAKKQQKKSSGGSPTTTIEDILRELTGEKPRQHKHTPPKEEKKEIFVEEPVKLFENKEPGLEIPRLEIEVLDQPSEGSDNGNHVEFDLKQAVIMDAILNRPYP